MKNPYISVIIPAFNAEKTIVPCLRSLIGQNYSKEKYEIILVDNNSADNTLKLAQNFKNITVLKETKKGPYAARNRGLKYTKGNIIAFTDSDCIADRNWLNSLSKAFVDKRVKVAGGPILSSTTKNTISRYYHHFGHMQHRFINSNMPFFAAANLAFRRDSRTKNLRFNESLLRGADVEFCSKLISNKKNIIYNSDAVVRHIYETSFISFLKQQFHYGKWNKSMKKFAGIDHKIVLPKHKEILKNHGIIFTILRLVEDFSWKLGYFFGKAGT